MSPGRLFATVDDEIAHLEEWQSKLADRRREALRNLRTLYRQRGAEHDDIRADGCTEMLNRIGS